MWRILIYNVKLQAKMDNGPGNHVR